MGPKSLITTGFPFKGVLYHWLSERFRMNLAKLWTDALPLCVTYESVRSLFIIIPIIKAFSKIGFLRIYEKGLGNFKLSSTISKTAKRVLYVEMIPAKKCVTQFVIQMWLSPTQFQKVWQAAFEWTKLAKREQNVHHDKLHNTTCFSQASFLNPKYT